MSCVTKTMLIPSSPWIAFRRLLEPIPRERIERAEGLVHQQDLRARGQGSRDADALLLTTGELVGHAFAKDLGLELHEGEELVDAVAAHLVGPAEQAWRDLYVLRHGEVWEQPDLLKAVADLSAQQVRLQAPHIPAANAYPTTRGLDQAVDHL